MPEGLSMTEAVSLVTTGTTAVRALVDVACLESGQRVLIRGGRTVTVAFGSSSALLSIAVSSIFGGGRIRSFPP